MRYAITEIEKLTPQERVAGYLALLAKLSEIGARLRTKYNDDEWTDEEQAEWDACTDELDPWFYAMKEDEKKAVQVVDSILGPLTRAEWPIINKDVLEAKRELAQLTRFAERQQHDCEGIMRPIRKLKRLLAKIS